MSVNSNPKASQQRRKNLLSQIFSHFITGVNDTGDQPIEYLREFS